VINVGIIGTGFARTMHIPAFRHCDARIVAIASGRLENAQRVAREFDIPFATSNWREVIERDDIDLISIVTPPAQHMEMTLAALDRGKAVLCEKPLATNSQATDTMRRRARESGVLALLDHELRFLSGRLRMREMLKDGAIGRVNHA